LFACSVCGLTMSDARHIVVGRAIASAKDPLGALQKIVRGFGDDVEPRNQ